MDLLVVKAFTCYHQMSSTALCTEWDNIVQENCFTPGWTNINGLTSAYERGQDWETLAGCKRLQHLLSVYKKDAAEHHCQYMKITVKKLQSMTIRSFYKRLKEIDALAPSLVCLKDQPDCVIELERMNGSLTPVNMYNLLMCISSTTFEGEYNHLSSKLQNRD